MQTARPRSFDDLDTPLHEVTFVVVDVETTGGSPTTSSLTEVAAARYRGGELLGTYQTFVRPDGRIPPFITALTGISDEMVADAPPVGEMLPSFLEFVGGAVLVGHNVRFDLSFINHALVSTNRDCLANDTVDTLALARRLVRDTVPDCKLGTLAATLRLPHRPSHRALSDVLATGDLLHAMLERAGSFGILGLDELLDLPRLIGHPQSAKLRLTTRLPHLPGVYWFTDATGSVLYVDRATDLHSRVRSHFSTEKRRSGGRLLRQLHAIHHRVCPHPLIAAVLEGRLIRAGSPPFNRPASGRRRSKAGRTRPADRMLAPVPRRHARVRRWNSDALAGDAADLLAPLVTELVDLGRQCRYEEAATVRDEAEGLRRLLAQHREGLALRQAGRVILSIDSELTVILDGGVLVEIMAISGNGVSADVERAAGWGAGLGTGTETGSVAGADLGMTLDWDRVAAGDGHHESVIVAQWLHTNAGRVRILEVGSDLGLALPAVRIPSLAELCPPTALCTPTASSPLRAPGETPHLVGSADSGLQAVEASEPGAAARAHSAA